MSGINPIVAQMIADTAAATHAGPVQLENNDASFGAYFIRCHGQDVRYNPQKACWLVWTGSVWREDDDDNEVTRRFKETFQRLVAGLEVDLARAERQWSPIAHKFFENGNPRRDENAPTAEELEIGRVHQAMATQLEIARAGLWAKRITNGLALAATEPGVVASDKEWNADPLLLNLANGAIDLRTLSFRENLREDLCTFQSPVSYDPKATCPRYREAFAFSIPQPEVREYMTDFDGLSLSGLTFPDIAIWLGEGSNGKGFLTRIKMGILGNYAAKISMNSFTASKNVTPGGARSDLAALRGKRLVVAAEISRRTSLDMEMLKDWTGNDEVSERDMYRTAKNAQFKPWGKFIFQMNNPPRIPDQTHGTWRRLKYILFEQTIPDGQQNENFHAELLAAEGPGILNLFLEGWQRVNERRKAGKPYLVAPPSIKDVTLEHKEKENQVARFFASGQLELNTASKIKSESVYQRYRSWCSRENELASSCAWFMRELNRYCREKNLVVRIEKGTCAGLAVCANGENGEGSGEPGAYQEDLPLEEPF